MDFNDNYLSSDIVNQDYEQNFNSRSIKKYMDYNDNIPINSMTRRPMNNVNSYNIKEIQNQTKENNNQFLDKLVIPERTISNFYGNDFLSDAVLKVDEFNLPFHKIVLCSASDFLYKYFTLNKNEQQNQKAVVTLPEIMKSTYSRGNKKDCMDKIIKYCYNNQDIKSIESDITQNNCFTMLELSHCLGIKSLNQNLEKLIIKHFLKDDNMIKLSEESINYELPELQKACANKIKKSLGNVTNKAKEMIDLDYDTFKDVISADELDVEGEKEVAELVLEYIKSRREIPEVKLSNPPPETQPKIEENEVKQNNENVENNENNEKNENEEKQEEEKKEEEKQEEEKKEEEKKEEEPPQNQENQEKNDNEEENKNNENVQNEENNNPPKNGGEDPYNSWKNHLIEMEKKSQKHRLTPDQEKTLIYCIRFSFLSHADLINLTNEPLMKDYKDLILQGLSARLNSYENTSDTKSLINLNPRKYLRKSKKSNMNSNYNDDDMNQNYYKSKMFNSVRNPNQYMPMYNDDRNNMNGNFNNNFSETSYYDENNNNSNYDEDFRKKRLAMMRKTSSTPYPPQDPRISEEFFRSQYIRSAPKPIFKYTYDFDENGALYYLGTKGKRHQYRNPHEINMVKAFASSISKGFVSDFVGRNLVNLRTENEENSFFGVDLGTNRTLVPSAYSIRNRNSSSHVMLCWNLEASNDRINFEVLDTRIFNNTNNPQLHQKLERERNLLKEPGCTSTWGISKKIKERFPEGFRYFLLKQIDRNSNGSYNLAISGFELYGEGKGRGWVFN